MTASRLPVKSANQPQILGAIIFVAIGIASKIPISEIVKPFEYKYKDQYG
jgi:hypothetical protein